MPYVKKFRREDIKNDIYDADQEKDLDCVYFQQILNAGELNYAITEMIRFYFQHRGANYTTINDIVGALECAKTEFNRRVVAPYEDTKILENGDVYK